MNRDDEIHHVLVPRRGKVVGCFSDGLRKLLRHQNLTMKDQYEKSEQRFHSGILDFRFSILGLIQNRQPKIQNRSRICVPLLGELNQMRFDLSLRRAAEMRIEIGINA